jgi:hypothetical protein
LEDVRSDRNERSRLPVVLLGLLLFAAVWGVGIVAWRSMQWKSVVAIVEVRTSQSAASSPSQTSAIYQAAELLHSPAVMRDALKYVDPTQLDSISKQQPPEVWLANRLHVSVAANSPLIVLTLEDNTGDESSEVQILNAIIKAFKAAVAKAESKDSILDVRTIQSPRVQ